MSSKKTTKSSQSTDSTIDPYSRSRIDQGTDNVRGMLEGNPYQPYQGERVAGLTGTQQEARGMVGGSGQDDIFTEAVERARLAGGYEPEKIAARTFADVDLSAYQNPYEDAVVQQTLQDISREKQVALNRTAGALTQSGAFGGDREAIIQAENQKNFDDRAAREVANLRASGFDRATSLAADDLGRGERADQTNASLAMQNEQNNLQVANLLASLGLSREESNRAEAGLLAQLGSEERSINQAGLDAQYEERLREQEDLYRRIAIEMGLISGTPVLVDSESQGQSVTKMSDPLGTAGAILGGAGSIASAAGGVPS
ncbi:MAG: hypothetical protein AAFX52_11115 [Pseudomonadota bacterium]